MEKTSYAHQIRFKQLHTKRGEVIAELYSLIVDAESDATSMARPLQMSGEPPQKDKQTKALKSGEKLSNYFSRNRIYFREELCKRVEKFIKGLYDALVEFNLVLDALENSRNHKDMMNQWIQTWGTLSEDIPLIKSEIENEFRQLLGIEEAS